VPRSFSHPICCDAIRDVGHEVYFVHEGSIRVKIGGSSSSHSPHADYCTFCGEAFPVLLPGNVDVVRLVENGKRLKEPVFCDGPFGSHGEAVERIKKRGDRHTDYAIVPATKRQKDR